MGETKGREGEWEKGGMGEREKKRKRERARGGKPPLKRGLAFFSLSRSPLLPLSHSPSPSLPVSFLIGVLTLAAVWLGPLPQLAQRAFFVHMTMHMGVVAVAAPLLALGIAGRRLDPVRQFPRLFAPVPASVVELIVVWAWHAPALHHAARHSMAGLLAEQGTFLFSGLLMWLSAFGGDSARRGDRAGAGVVGLLLTSMHMTLLGALLALTPRALYAHKDGLWGLTPLEDQHLGGAIMLLVGGVSYLAGGLWLTAELVRGTALKPRGET